MRKTVIRVVKGIILLVAIVTLANMTYKHIRTYYDDYMDEYKGTESTQGEDVTVTIPEGASVKEIAQILKDNGLINYPRAFTKRLQDSEYRGKLHGGTYTLNTGMTTLQMMAAMQPDIRGRSASRLSGCARGLYGRDDSSAVRRSGNLFCN